MMTRVNKNIIQAIPLSKDTKVVNSGDTFAPNKDSIEVIRALQDTQINVVFNDSTNVSFDMPAGMDMSVGDDVISIEVVSGQLIAG